MLYRLACVVLCLMLSACGSRGGGISRDAGAVIGESLGGRSIATETFGRGPVRVYLIGSIHGDEREGRSALEDIRRELARSTGGTTVRLVTDMNPDGSVAGTRANGAGVDLNRNWPAKNFRAAKGRGGEPLSEPEAAAVHADVVRFDPHMVIVLHSARGGPFVNFDGPDAARQLAESFAAGARSAGDSRWRVVEDMGYPTPGSMGSYFGVDRGVPILTVELRRGDEAERVPAPLVAGLRSVLADRRVALLPMSLSGPAPVLAGRGRAEPGAAEPAR